MYHIKRSFFFFSMFLLTGSILAQSNNLSNRRKYWVFFRDKGPGVLLEKAGFSKGLQLGISRRALDRRAKMREKEQLVDVTDLPVSPKYIEVIKEMGLKPLVVARWLNAISVVISADLVSQIRSLSFVKKLQPVAYFRLKPFPEKKGEGKVLMKEPEFHKLDYGMSYQQNNMIHVPEVHDLGINGKGILIGMLDTGFDYENRTVFQDLDVVAEHDFQWNDDTTANQTNDPYNQDQHGTMTLSVIAGFDPGNLIGPAYQSSFILAKTEWVATETRIEEDHWVAGIEWMEKLGVDVVSSSLGYGVFDDSSGYKPEDLNGDKCVTTIAADIAASKGVVVVNSAGNRDFWPYVNSPADGDSVIAVGAVDSEEYLANFSSVGPTADGRVKPDVVAMGIGVCAVNPARDSKTEDYISVSGTSFSCSLVAGVCALVLQAHPELGPMEVRDAIRETAKRIPVDSDSINNQYGWGLVDAYRAIFYYGMIFTNFKRVLLTSEDLEAIDVDVLSRTGIKIDSLFLFYQIDEKEEFHKVKLVYKGGEAPANFRAKIPSSVNLEKIDFYIQGLDTLGVKHTGPVGAPRVLYSFSDTSSGLIFIKDRVPEKFYLYQNYPNPFNSTTTIAFDLSKRAHVTITIYNLLGQRVITILDRVLEPGKQELIWNGRDRFDRQVVSGLYFYQLRTDHGVIETRKMILSK